jgi:WD40 repeat protein
MLPVVHTPSCSVDILSLFCRSWSPDNACILCRSYDHTLRLWDVVHGVHPNTFKCCFFYRILQMTRVLCLDPAIELLGRGLQRMAHISTQLWVIPMGLLPLHSPRIVNISSLDLKTTLLDWDAAASAYLNAFIGHSDAIISSHSPLVAQVSCLGLKTILASCVTLSVFHIIIH